MITRQEIMDFSRELGLNPNSIEKDYVLGWILDGISNHPKISADWLFKGGTCLKKCYFETYRFSEDLDFTVKSQENMDYDFLRQTFGEITDLVYEKTGIEIPKELIDFEIYQNTRGKPAVEGRLSYRGPMQPGGALPRIKLDLTADEILVLKPVVCEVHHRYSDQVPGKGIQIQCYCFEELFAEKLRTLAERLRPRDLYDVIHLYRHDALKPSRVIVLETLRKKCDFKGIPLPSAQTLEDSPEKIELEKEWSNMLAHQLTALPSYEQFWQELPKVFAWLYQASEKVAAPLIPAGDIAIDQSRQMAEMMASWHTATTAPLEIIRFAAVNRLCVALAYQGSTRLIEPYSLRMTKDGNLLLYAVKHDTQQARAYRADRIEGAQVTSTTFTPKYTVELTDSGPISTPAIAAKPRHFYHSR
jgi:predicted nucleotidyltransferase component of viral defense system